MKQQNLICPAEYGAEQWSQYVFELLSAAQNQRMAVYLKFIPIWKIGYNSKKSHFGEEK